MRKHNKNRAFTLIEILIVVVILGILAAIIIPQFTEASEDAELSSVRSTLQTVRAQLELYKFKEGAYPAALVTMTDGNSPSGDIYLQDVPANTANWTFNYAGAATGAITATDGTDTF